jgi:hypothetical protein
MLQCCNSGVEVIRNHIKRLLEEKRFVWRFTRTPAGRTPVAPGTVDGRIVFHLTC